MLLDEVIELCKEKSKSAYELTKNYEQLSQWLVDYKKLKERDMSKKRDMPKKPIKNEMGKISFLDKFVGIEATYTCPNCGNALLKHYMNERQETRYCWDCGQALEWRDEE